MRYMSHELRTPLNIIDLSMGFVETEVVALKSLVGRKTIQPLQEAINDVQQSSQTATALLNDFLIFDKLKGGKFDLCLQHTDPNAFFRESFQQFKVLGLQKHVDFKFVCNEAELGWFRHVYVKLDPLKFGQVKFVFWINERLCVQTVARIFLWIASFLP